MTSKGDHQARRRLFPIVTSIFLLALWGAQSGALLAQEGPAPNIIVSIGDPGVRRDGAFQPISTRLGHSQAPLRSIGPGSHSVTFTAGISQPGYYRVFVWWPQVYGAVGSAVVMVSHAQGTSTVTMSQALTGQWVPVGIFQFSAAGAQVNLVGKPGVTLLADAVRLQYMGAAQPPLAFDTDALPVAVVGEQYTAQFAVIGGTGPYTFAVVPTVLPPGLQLDAVSGALSGSPAVVGTYPFDVQVFDRDGQRAVQSYTIDVVPGSAATPTGLAQLSGPVRITAKDGAPAGTPPDLSNLINILASLPEGEWVRVNLNAYSDVWTPADLRPLYGPSNPNPSKIIVPWSSFAWDPNRGDLWLYGGGHANYPGNDIYHWRGTTQMWVRGALPSEIKQDDLGYWEAVDGWDAAPSSAHTYDNNMFFPHIDRLVAFGGAAFNSGGAYKREVTPTTQRITGPFFFNPSLADPNKVGGTTGSHVMRVAPHPEIVGGNMWANRDIYINIPSHPSPLAHVDGCTAYADENGRDVAYLGARNPGGTALNLYKYTVNDLSNPALDTLKQIGQWWVGTQIQTSCALDPVRNVLVRTGSQTTTPFSYWNLATPGATNRDVAVTPVDPTGEFGSLVANGQIKLENCGFDFDPIGAQFMLWCGDGRVWALTPPATLSANGWTIVKQPSPSLATPNGDVGTGILGKWKYISNLDAFMGLQDATLGNIWLYKPIGWVNPSGGGGTTINPPIGVAASDGTSTSSVTVTWTASTGASSYTVYRSTSSGSQGSSVGTTSLTSFTDNTPVPGTTYFYGVTATGSGGTSVLSAQDSGFAAVAGTGGRLTATSTVSSLIDLTSVGATDWIHWLPLNRKASGGFIGDYVPVGNATITAYSDDPRSFTWTDGTPNANGTDSTGATTSGTGAGFSFSVAADTTTRTLLVYVGGLNSAGALSAHLSDSSAPDLINLPLSGSGRYDGFYTLVYKAASAGQQLQITWTQTTGVGSITLQGATLQ